MDWVGTRSRTTAGAEIVAVVGLYAVLAALVAPHLPRGRRPPARPRPATAARAEIPRDVPRDPPVGATLAESALPGPPGPEAAPLVPWSPPRLEPSGADPDLVASRVARELLAGRAAQDELPAVAAPLAFRLADPSEPEERWLAAKAALLAGRDPRAPHTLAGARPLELDVAAGAALAVDLASDVRDASGRTRALVELRIAASPQDAGARLPRALALVLDAGAPHAVTTALAEAVLEAQEVGDRLHVLLATRTGPRSLEGEPRLGAVTLALEEAAAGGGEGPVGLAEAIRLAAEAVTGELRGSPYARGAVLVATADPVVAGDEGSGAAAAAAAKEGVMVSVLAIVDGEAPSLDGFDRLALSGRGRRQLLRSPEDAAGSVAEELDLAGRLVARDPVVGIRLAPGVALVDVLGAAPVDAESIPQLMSDDGIVVLLPDLAPGAEQRLLLDVVVPGPGDVAEATLRYVDLLERRPTLARAHLSLGGDGDRPGPREAGVLASLVSLRAGATLARASELVAEGRREEALATLAWLEALVAGVCAEVPGLLSDPDLEDDGRMVSAYLDLLRGPALPAELELSLRAAARLEGRPAARALDAE